MDVTLKGYNQRTKQSTYTASDVYQLLEAVRMCKYEAVGLPFRHDYPHLADVSASRYYKQIYKVMVACRYQKDASGGRVFRSYSGVIPIKVEGLAEKSAIYRVKNEAMLLPQTLAAMEGCEGRSVVILVCAELPGHVLPQTEGEAELFHVKAYRTAVQCYAPTLSRPITVEEARLDMEFLMPFDEGVLVNTHAVPFVIQQPTEQEVKRLIDARVVTNLVCDKRHTWEGLSMNQIFNDCYQRVRHDMSDAQWFDDETRMVALAHECAEIGMPEESATRLLLMHFYKLDNQDVRSTVRSVYEGYSPLPELRPGLPKKQVASIRLKSFLERRYELRRNVVTGQTEYRVKGSFDFRFHELTKVDKNTLKYEAALEGIEAFDAEINGFIDSNYTPNYNPIDEYLAGLQAWDGVERIGQLADLVPTDTPNWKRLFRRWFLSMVAHWMDYDLEHGNNTAPILIGKQGFRKSTFCRILLPPELRDFFADSVDFRTKQEAERYLTRFLLINIDEFDQLSEKQFAFVKHLFQKPNVSMRRMYSEAISHQRRYASFIGTSNHQDILRDPTGNRRYLCVEVKAPIHTDVAIEYAQLYAEAVHLIRHGERYWLDDEDEALLKESNKSFETQSPLELIVLDLFEVAEEGAFGARLMKTTDIMIEVSKHPAFNRGTMNNMVSLGRALTHIGFKTKRKADGMYYWVSSL